MVVENNVSIDKLSTFLDSIGVFDCRQPDGLPGVNPDTLIWCSDNRPIQYDKGVNDGIFIRQIGIKFWEIYI